MARPVSWLPRLPEIRRSVATSIREQYDRGALEQLFQLQPRAAGNLMKVLPRVKAPGGARLVERGPLLAFLERVSKAEDVGELLGEVRTANPVAKRSVRVKVLPGGNLAPDGPLPESVTLERGGVHVKYETFRQFLQGMFAIAAMVQNDPDGFERDYCVEQVEQAPARDRDLDEFLAAVRRQNDEFDAWMANKRSQASGCLSGCSLDGSSPLQPTPAEHYLK